MTSALADTGMGEGSVSSPMERTLKYLRDRGYHAEVTERWVPGARIRKDLWGFVDVLAISPTNMLAVQCTSASNVSARVKKIADSEHLPILRGLGVDIHVHGWTNGKPEPRIVDLS